jgi:enterochelin esterase-like enzyme
MNGPADVAELGAVAHYFAVHPLLAIEPTVSPNTRTNRERHEPDSNPRYPSASGALAFPWREDDLPYLKKKASQANPEQQWLPGPEKITLRSEVLGEERTILVRLPEGYEKTTRKYPVSELGYDKGQHPIPELIVIGVVNVDRDRDYTPTHAPEQSNGRLSFPTSGGAEAFREFLEREVFPLVESRYRTHPDRTLSGWSNGGLFTVHTFLENPSLFSRYLAISPSLWWDESVLVKDTRERLSRSEPSRAGTWTVRSGSSSSHFS